MQLETILQTIEGITNTTILTEAAEVDQQAK